MNSPTGYFVTFVFLTAAVFFAFLIKESDDGVEYTLSIAGFLAATATTIGCAWEVLNAI